MNCSWDEDWKLFSQAGHGFLHHLPVLSNTPAMETRPPTNREEVVKCMDSAEQRVRSVSDMKSLKGLLHQVYTKRAEVMHWNLESTFELNYRVGEANVEDQEDISVEEEEGTLDEGGQEEDPWIKFDYRSGTMVAVRTIHEEEAPFWMTQVKHLSKDRKKVHVLWYEAKSKDKDSAPFYDTFKPIAGCEDTISVETIHLNFQSLTSTGQMKSYVAKGLRSLLVKD